MRALLHKPRPAAADKRAAIIAAALELFNERSFNGTPMPLVAERAGVGAGTIYRYFASKDALGNAVYRECKLAVQRHLLERARSGLSPRQEFSAMWHGLWEFFKENPAAFRFLETHNHGSYLDRASGATSDAVSVSIADFVRRGQVAGVIRRGEPAVLIAMAFGAFIGLVKEADAGRFALTRRLVESAEECGWAMLCVPPARGRRGAE
jgi:TetR/AcrR family transcriptional regulator, repressor of fatR-cypB operon